MVSLSGLMELTRHNKARPRRTEASFSTLHPAVWLRDITSKQDLAAGINGLKWTHRISNKILSTCTCQPRASCLAGQSCTCHLTRAISMLTQRSQAGDDREASLALDQEISDRSQTTQSCCGRSRAVGSRPTAMEKAGDF